MPSLLTMPALVMDHILDKLDYRSIQCLRKSCQDLRHFIDDIEPESKLATIEVKISRDSVLESYSVDVAMDFQNKQNINIVYGSQMSGCLVKCSNISKLLEKSDYLDIAFRDIQQILETSGTLSLFSVCLFYIHHRDPVALKFSKRFRTFLESKSVNVKTKGFKINFVESAQVLDFLPFMDSKVLEKIHFYGFCVDLTNIVKSDQWKKSKEFILNCPVNIMIQDLTHFEKLEIRPEPIDNTMLQDLKKAFSDHLHMQSVFINSDQYICNQQFLILLFGQPYRNDLNIIQWFHKIPTDFGKVLLIEKNNYGCGFGLKISFTRVDKEKVPTNALVLD